MPMAVMTDRGKTVQSLAVAKWVAQEVEHWRRLVLNREIDPSRAGSHADRSSVTTVDWKKKYR